jgi:hypothetical protein
VWLGRLQRPMRRPSGSIQRRLLSSSWFERDLRMCPSVRALTWCLCHVLQGNEANGLRTNIIKECDAAVSVPLDPGSCVAPLVDLQVLLWLVSVGVPSLSCFHPDAVAFGLDSLNVSVAGGILLREACARTNVK